MFGAIKTSFPIEIFPTIVALTPIQTSLPIVGAPFLTPLFSCPIVTPLCILQFFSYFAMWININTKWMTKICSPASIFESTDISINNLFLKYTKHIL